MYYYYDNQHCADHPYQPEQLIPLSARSVLKWFETRFSWYLACLFPVSVGLRNSTNLYTKQTKVQLGLSLSSLRQHKLLIISFNKAFSKTHMISLPTRIVGDVYRGGRAYRNDGECLSFLIIVFFFFWKDKSRNLMLQGVKNGELKYIKLRRKLRIHCYPPRSALSAK